MTRPRAADLVPVAVALVLAVVGVAATAPTVAFAHDALVASEPADGAVLASAPSQLVLTFTGEQLPVGSAVTVTGPDGEEWADGAPAVAGTTVTQALRSDLLPGAYAVSWRSVSADGHPIEGTFGFTVEGTASPDPVEPSSEPTVGGTEPTVEPAPPTVQPDAEDTSDDGDEPVPSPAPGVPTGGSDPPVLWLVGALAAATLAAVVVAGVRRRQPPGDG